MTEEKSPYAPYYNEGRTVGANGGPSSSCPYQPTTGPDRREQLTRRMAWLEGHVDGDRARLAILARGRSRQPKGPARPAVRATVQRRYQRNTMRAAGGPERYVDRRLRQIQKEQVAEQVTCAESDT